MSFLSGLKKVGKVALKVAPYAAMAIPGIGIPASMAIQAGLGAANAKVAGGGLKSVLLGAGIGAGTGAISGGAGNVAKGLAPSTGVAEKAASGVGSKLGSFATKTAANALGTDATKSAITKGVLSKAMMAMQNAQNPSISSPNGASPTDVMPRPGAVPAPSDQYPGGFGQNFSEDQNNPNLANSINQGKLDALKNRPLQRLQRQYGYTG